MYHFSLQFCASVLFSDIKYMRKHVESGKVKDRFKLSGTLLEE